MKYGDYLRNLRQSDVYTNIFRTKHKVNYRSFNQNKQVVPPNSVPSSVTCAIVTFLCCLSHFELIEYELC